MFKINATLSNDTVILNNETTIYNNETKFSLISEFDL